jgi:hypothetical protein
LLRLLAQDLVTFADSVAEREVDCGSGFSRFCVVEADGSGNSTAPGAGDALLSLLFFSIARPSRKLKSSGALGQGCQQSNVPVRKIERIVMDVR